MGAAAEVGCMQAYLRELGNDLQAGQEALLGSAAGPLARPPPPPSAAAQPPLLLLQQLLPPTLPPKAHGGGGKVLLQPRRPASGRARRAALPRLRPT